MSLIKKLILLFCLMGIAVSSYLLYGKLFGSEIICGISSCGTVNESKYSMLFDVPVSALGLLFYSGMAFVTIVKMDKLFLIGSIFGVLFSAYLSFIEAFVIHAWCQWCVLSAWITICLFLLGLRQFKLK
ncbi:hypothetical protein CO178_00930 [candidate division WWE3 bacterium CG_4_9_14_3_um_filter_34_6]|uniref:Vitamin K epoxide reductase domain-containing protein n=1 Tax=candidate division WWE3 bacterium CG_4_9_14_3_um_filter_34_6 TaxID=1975079 RepID=A0A2M7X4M0_UNCKA|nr:MAG: hypothetical protein CO178_00930 [candidate division WWE3 bacterium CG_4_9_14_3_um_filter_34_6]